MSGSTARRLEPVGSEFQRVETVSRELRETQLPVYGPGAAAAQRSSLRAAAPEQLQVMAALLWQCWLIVAGTVVGVTVLAVLVKVAAVVLGWAL